MQHLMFYIIFKYIIYIYIYIYVYYIYICTHMYVYIRICIWFIHTCTWLHNICIIYTSYIEKQRLHMWYNWMNEFDRTNQFDLEQINLIKQYFGQKKDHKRLYPASSSFLFQFTFCHSILRFTWLYTLLFILKK